MAKENPNNRPDAGGQSRSGDARPNALSIDELRERYQALHQQKIRAEANRETAEQRLSELKLEARETYGTDDVEELKRKLEELKAENERKRADYQAHIEQVESDLAKVETEVEGETHE